MIGIMEVGKKVRVSTLLVAFVLVFSVVFESRLLRKFVPADLILNGGTVETEDPVKEVEGGSLHPMEIPHERLLQVEPVTTTQSDEHERDDPAEAETRNASFLEINDERAIPTPTPTPTPTTNQTETSSNEDLSDLEILKSNISETRDEIQTISDPPVSREPDMHSSNVEIVGLLHWEVRSLKKPYTRSCRVPEGVDEVCCLGTQSQTGRKFKKRHLCDHLTYDDYDQVRLHAQQQLDLTPIVDSDASRCDACRIVEILREHKLKFAFFGDSLTNQVEQAWSCELQRRNYIVTRQGLPFQKCRDPAECALEYRRRIIHSPLWGANNETNQVAMDFWFQYRVPIVIPEERERFAREYDVVIASFGMHWAHTYDPIDGHAHEKRWNRDTYAGQLADYFNHTRQAGKVRLLAHRESNAQHFDAEGGEFSLAKRKPDFANSNCVALYDTLGNMSGWREPLVRQAAEAANYRVVETGRHMPPKDATANHSAELYIIPFYDFTAQHWTMHPQNRRHLDCTHMCHSPFMFQPIWRAIRLAMDREFTVKSGVGEQQ